MSKSVLALPNYVLLCTPVAYRPNVHFALTVASVSTDIKKRVVDAITKQ